MYFCVDREIEGYGKVTQIFDDIEVAAACCDYGIVRIIVFDKSIPEEIIETIKLANKPKQVLNDQIKGYESMIQNIKNRLKDIDDASDKLEEYKKTTNFWQE